MRGPSRLDNKISTTKEMKTKIKKLSLSVAHLSFLISISSTFLSCDPKKNQQQCGPYWNNFDVTNRAFFDWNNINIKFHHWRCGR